MDVVKASNWKSVNKLILFFLQKRWFDHATIFRKDFVSNDVWWEKIDFAVLAKKNSRFYFNMAN